MISTTFRELIKIRSGITVKICFIQIWLKIFRTPNLEGHKFSSIFNIYVNLIENNMKFV